MAVAVGAMVLIAGDGATIARPMATPPGGMADAGGTPPPVPAAVAAAPVALLVDMSSGRTLYARDADRRFLPASVTKVMTAYTAFDLLSQGRLRADQPIAVSDSAWAAWHAKGSRMFLARGSRPTVDQLLMGIATVSANDGCIVLAEGAAGSVAGWVALMNAEARRLGMTGSHFGTPNGWMDKGNTYYTARDLATLAEAMIARYPQYYHRYIGHKWLTWNGITQPNHDPVIGIVAGADGIKTGFTDEARYTYVGSAERGGRRLVMVLAAVPTAPERARAARALLEWGFDAWNAWPLFAAGDIVGQAEVQQGSAATVGLVAPRPYFLTMAPGEAQPVSLHVIYEGPMRAPITRGAHVADLEIRIGSAAPVRMPLVAASDVARGDAFDRLRAGLTELLR
ncbi:MAG: D-alanyl-D-alanine carboxypeptidase [Sphingomonadales bacterium]|nr:D-alanyl-D-alanine carboxypeptidase [Sphingomonadales bacterium]